MAETITSSVADSSRKNSIPLAQLTETLEGEWRGTPVEIVHGVRIDSRKCEQGDLFVALEGEETDGHRFLSDASANGACAAVVREPQDIDLPQFVCKEPAGALQQLSQSYRELRSELFVIGITGSCGKTTVKEIIGEFLSKKYKTGRTLGNQNNGLGVPLTILNEGSGDVLIVEMGMNSPGEISRLVKWARPRVGVVTHIGPEHLEGLGSIHVVARENAQLLSALPEDGMGFLPAGIPRGKQLTQISAVEPRLVEYEITERLPEQRKTRVNLDSEEYLLPFTASHLVENICLSISVARELGVFPEDIQEKLQSLELVSGRGRIRKLGKTRVIDGSYNANPDSFRTAIERFQSFPGPRLALVGDMLELGAESERFHRDLGDQLSELDNTEIYYVGEFTDEVRAGLGSDNQAEWFSSVEELPTIDPTEFQSVLVKSSHGVGLHRVLDEWIKQP